MKKQRHSLRSLNVKTVPLTTIKTALLLAASVASLVGCEDKKQVQGVMEMPVETVTVRTRDIPRDLSFVARTVSSRKVEIYSRVNGFLDKRLYTEGGMVEAGETLFTIDPRPFQAQLQQAEAALESTKAAHLVAKQNLDRIRPLARMKALSQTDLDNAVGTFNTTAAQVSSAQAQVETAKLNLSYCTVTSPVSGLADSALETDGTYINTENAHLTTVYAMSPMWIVFSMSENEQQKLTQEVKDGLLALPKDLNFTTRIRLGLGDELPEVGHITFQSPNYNPNTGTFEIRSSVKNADGILKPQQFVRVILQGAYYKNALAVPQVAVQQGAQSHYVWVISSDNKAEYRPVSVGEWVGSEWVITGGLKDGDRVVTAGMLMLGNGTPVKVALNTEQVSRAKDSNLQKDNLEELQTMRGLAPASRSSN